MSSDTDRGADWWRQWLQLNEEYAATATRTLDAQSRLADAWSDSVDEATRAEHVDEWMEATVDAHELWMRAAQETIEQANDVMEGESVPPERFRDTWLNAANGAFEAFMETSAFASATGQSVEDALALKRQVDDAVETTLSDLRLPTRGGLEEIGERLVELERRQHEVESRLDEILDAIEKGA